MEQCKINSIFRFGFTGIIALFLSIVLLCSPVFAAGNIPTSDNELSVLTGGDLSLVAYNNAGNGTNGELSITEFTSGVYRIYFTATQEVFWGTTTTVTITNNSGKKLNISYSTDANDLADGTATTETVADGGTLTQWTVSGKGVSATYYLSYSVAAETFTPTFAAAIGGTYTVNDVTVSTSDYIPQGNALKNNITPYTLTATADTANGYAFLGWYSSTSGGIFSTSATVSYTCLQEETIFPVFRVSGNAVFFVPGDTAAKYYYSYLDLAISAAKNTTGKLIKVVGDGDAVHSNPSSFTNDAKITFTVDSGVKLLVPYSASDTGTFSQAPVSTDFGASYNYLAPTYNAPAKTVNNVTYQTLDYSHAYKTLTVPENTVINVTGGSVNVNSLVHTNGARDTGCPHGAYGQIILESGAELNINTDGNLYCYGFITGTFNTSAEYTGGTVTSNGGAVYELFQIRDWRGGTATTYFMKFETESFPISQYYVQNIEANYIVYPGSTSGAILCVKVDGSVIEPVTGVMTGTNGLFNLSSGYVKRTYDPTTERITYSVYSLKDNNGNITEAGALSLDSIVLTVSDIPLDSSEYILGLNNNITLNIEDGCSVTINSRIKLLPGAQISVKEGATLTVASGAALYIYDKNDWSTSYTFWAANNSLQDVGSTGTSINDNRLTRREVVRYSPSRDAIYGAGVQVKTRTYGSACVVVDGTLQAYGNIFTTNGNATATGDNTNLGVIQTVGYASYTPNNSTADDSARVLTGTGVFINSGEWHTNTFTVSYSSTTHTLTHYGELDEFTGSGDTAARVHIPCLPVVGLLSGVSTGATDVDDSFATGTYYGQSNGYWYNWIVKADSADSFGEFTPGTVTGFSGSTVDRYNSTSKEQDTISNVLGLVSYYWDGSASVQSTFQTGLSTTDGSWLGYTGGGANIQITPTMQSSGAQHIFSYGLSAVGADVNLYVSSTNPTIIEFVASNADHASICDTKITFPSGANVSNFYADKVGTKASSSNIGGTVYHYEEAIAAIGPEAGNYAQAFMKISEAVTAATGDNTYVTVLVDRTLTDAIVVTEGQNITLDLNGKTLTGKVATVFAGANGQKLVTNNGTLTLISSAETAGKITFNGAYALTDAGKSPSLNDEARISATLFNKGTILYIENVTLEQSYNNLYVAALFNGTGATINEIRSGTIKAIGYSNGMAIVNSGTIKTIGTSGNTVTIIGRRGIALFGRIDTIGGEGSTVDITCNQRGINTHTSTASVGTIGKDGSTVNITVKAAGFGRTAIYGESSGVFEVIGGKNSTLNITIEEGTIYAQTGINITTAPSSGEAVIIGEEGSTINITVVNNVASSNDAANVYGIRNSTKVKIGASGSTININVNQKGNGKAYGIYNTGTITKLGTVCSSTEIVSNQYGIYNTKTIGEIRGDVVVISTDAGTDTSTGYFALYSTGTIQIYSGDYYHASGLRAKAVYLPDTAAYYPTCHALSTATRDVVVDGIETPYACYYIVTSHKWTSGCVCETCNIIRFYGTNINLGNNLDMMFAFPTTVFATGTDLTNYYVEFVRADGTTTKVLFKDWAKLGISGTETVEGDGYYVVYHSFAAKEMCDTVTVTIYDNTGKVISISKTDSIQAYAKRMLDKTSNANLKQVIICMLNYGSACQVQFGYNTDSLANSILDESSRLSYVPKTGSTITVDPNASDKKIAGHNLVVESNIKFYVAFNGVAENTEVEVSFTGHKNNEESYTATVNSQGYIEITGLVVADHKSTISLKIGNTTLTTSIDAYISGMGEGETNNVFYAFNQFAAAAYTYQHPEEAAT